MGRGAGARPTNPSGAVGTTGDDLYSMAPPFRPVAQKRWAHRNKQKKQRRYSKRLKLNCSEPWSASQRWCTSLTRDLERFGAGESHEVASELPRRQR
jgi:hypothetical protein